MRIAGFVWILGGFVVAGYRAFTGCPRRSGAGPAGLRWLLKSPPRHAGQAPTALRATRFNPARGWPVSFRCFHFKFHIICPLILILYAFVVPSAGTSLLDLIIAKFGVRPPRAGLSQSSPYGKSPRARVLRRRL